jgi:GNAT superfamily N-acetyltransferase
MEREDARAALSGAMAEAEAIERASSSALFSCAGATPLQRSLQLSAQTCGPALVLRCPGIDHVLFNRTLGLHDAVPEIEALADSVVARYQAQNIGRYFVHVEHGAEHSPLRQRLTALGLTRYPRAWHVLVRDRGSVRSAPSSLHVERARPADATALVPIVLAGFDLPDPAAAVLTASIRSAGFHTYVARDDAGTLAAVMLMYVQAELAHVCMMATAPSHRGRGAQSALLERGLRVALDLGCKHISAETGEAIAGEPNPSHDNLERAGFRVAGVRENWAPRGTQWSAGASARRGP